MQPPYSFNTLVNMIYRTCDIEYTRVKIEYRQVLIEYTP